MKKVLIGLSLIFCAVSAPETQSYCDETIKMALAGYIDKTDEFYAYEFGNALNEFADTLNDDKNNKFYNGKTAKQYVKDNMVQLILYALWFRQFWRVCGNDPYVAGWFAKLYASLLYYDLSGLDKNFLKTLARDQRDLKIPSTGEISKVKVYKESLYEKDKKDKTAEREDNTLVSIDTSVKGGLFRLNYKGLEHTLFGDLEQPGEQGGSVPSNESKLVKKKKKIISTAVRYLRRICYILNLDSKAQHRAEVQKLALPYELIYVLRANDFLLDMIRDNEKGLLLSVEGDSNATSSSTSSTSNLFIDLEDADGSFKLAYFVPFGYEETMSLPAATSSSSGSISTELFKAHTSAITSAISLKKGDKFLSNIKYSNSDTLKSLKQAMLDKQYDTATTSSSSGSISSGSS